MNAATTRAIADFVVEYFQAGYPEGDGLASAIEHRWPDADQEDVMFAMYMVANLARTRPDAFPDLAKLEWVKMFNRAIGTDADAKLERHMANRAGGTHRDVDERGQARGRKNPMVGWLAKKAQDTRINMCVKEVVWDLESGDGLRRATILALAQLLRSSFQEERLLTEALDRPLNLGRDDLLSLYERLETLRNQGTAQLEDTQASMRRFGTELPQFAIDHAKSMRRGLEVWMCTIGAGIVAARRDDVRDIWSYLSGAFDHVEEAISHLRDVERRTGEMTGSADAMGFALIETNQWIELCRFIPSEFSGELRASAQRLAAEQGIASAQFNLGFMYRHGDGVPQDYAEAAKWYGLAAEQGNVKAQFNLGLMYAAGRGVPQDHAEALKWFRFAAEQGLASAQHNLGSMYASGRGVPQDYVQAHMWFNLAASLAPATEAEERELPGALPGHTGAQCAPNRRRAIDYRDSVASKLTPAQIAEAQKLAREWKPK